HGAIHCFVLVPEFSYSSMTGLLLNRLFVASTKAGTTVSIYSNGSGSSTDLFGCCAAMMSYVSPVNICLMVTACTYQAAMAVRLSTNWQNCIAGSQKTAAKSTTRS